MLREHLNNMVHLYIPTDTIFEINKSIVLLKGFLMNVLNKIIVMDVLIFIY